MARGPLQLLHREYNQYSFPSKQKNFIDPSEGTMNQPDKAEFNIEVSATDTTDEDIDQMTRQLLSELREMDVESAELAKGGVPPTGTKSVDPVMMGNIAIAVLPALLPQVVGLVQAWATRGHGRSVKFKGKVAGQLIDFEGSAEELQKLLETLSKGKKKK
jgi:hypothetical protein